MNNCECECSIARRGIRVNGRPRDVEIVASVTKATPHYPGSASFLIYPKVYVIKPIISGIPMFPQLPPLPHATI